MRLTLILLFSWLMLNGSMAQEKISCPEDIYDFGPRGLDKSSYSTLYLVINHEKVDSIYWYSLFLNDLFYAKLNFGEKYIMKIYKPGAYNIWTSTDVKSSVDVTLEMNRSYYLLLQLKPGKLLYPIPELQILDSVKGSQLFSLVSDTIIHINYPVAKIKDVPMSKKQTDVRYIDYNQSYDYGFLKVKPPKWIGYVEFVPFWGWVDFGYFDPFVSKTYSEVARLHLTVEKIFRDTTKFNSYVLKYLQDMVIKTETLVKRHRELFNLPGKFHYADFNITYDYRAPNKGSNEYLEIHNFVAFIYVEKGKTGKVYQMLFSQRGTPGELRDYESFKCRALDYFSKITVSPDSIGK